MPMIRSIPHERLPGVLCAASLALALIAAPAEVRADNTWLEVAKLHASDAAELDHFGYAVAIEGATIIVGA